MHGQMTHGPVEFPTYARNPEPILLHPAVSCKQVSGVMQQLPQGEIDECPAHAACARGFD
jgi:hypothetical protein